MTFLPKKSDMISTYNSTNNTHSTTEHIRSYDNFYMYTCVIFK